MSIADADLAALARLVDGLEAERAGYLTLAEVRDRWPGSPEVVSRAVRDDILLVDHRRRLAADGTLEPVVVCRLNRHHPVARSL